MNELNQYGKVIREYKGTGVLDFGKGLTVDCDFKCAQLYNSEIIIYLEYFDTWDTLKKLFNSERGSVEKWKLCGKVEDRCSLIAENLVSERRLSHIATQEPTRSEAIAKADRMFYFDVNFKNNEITECHFGLTNFIFSGNEIIHTQDGMHRAAQFSGSLDNFLFHFIQMPDYDNIVADLRIRNCIDVTSKLVLKIQNLLELQNMENLVDDICWLLSFAQGKTVNWIYWDGIDVNGRVVESHYRYSKTGAYTGGPYLIDPDEASDIKYFLTKTFSKFEQVKDEWELLSVIGYILESKEHSTIQIKFILLFIALATLVSSFNRKFGSHGTFKPSLKALLEDGLKIKDYDPKFPFMEIRNQIIKTGKLPGDFNTNIKEYFNLLNLIERIVLKILDYDGYYFDCLDLRKKLI